MIKKIISLIICILMIAGGTGETAERGTAVRGGGNAPVAALILSESTLDPLLKPNYNLLEVEQADRKHILPDAVSGKNTIRRFSQQELDLLARLVQAEAGGEPYNGKVAVAATVLNRVESPRYPNTLTGVIYQVNYGYQYCPVRNGTINRPAGEDARRAMHEALRGNDPTGGALSFYNPAKATNSWIRSRPVFSQIGNHVFVR